MAYDCHKNKKCAVDRVTRNRCQSCRFEKCLQVGMNPGTVRADKNRKRKNGSESDRELELNETRDTMNLLKQVTESFKSLFPPERRFDRLIEAREAARQFLVGVTEENGELSAKDREVMLNQGFQAFLVLRAVFCGDTKCVDELDEIFRSVR